MKYYLYNIFLNENLAKLVMTYLKIMMYFLNYVQK